MKFWWEISTSPDQESGSGRRWVSLSKSPFVLPRNGVTHGGLSRTNKSDFEFKRMAGCEGLTITLVETVVRKVNALLLTKCWHLRDRGFVQRFLPFCIFQKQSDEWRSASTSVNKLSACSAWRVETARPVWWKCTCWNQLGIYLNSLGSTEDRTAPPRLRDEIRPLLIAIRNEARQWLIDTTPPANSHNRFRWAILKSLCFHVLHICLAVSLKALKLRVGPLLRWEM